MFIAKALKEDQQTYQFHVISFENSQYPLTADQEAKVAQWQKDGLKWTPLQWHAGTGAKNKLQDIWQGLWAVAKLRRKGYKYIMGFASVAGAMSYLYARVLGLRLYIHSYEP
ncbi:MAG: hypothetical protein C4330_14120, partial [Chitinophagaceae bacterium]